MPPKGGGLKALVKYGNSTLENVDLSSFESLIITIQKKWSGFKYMAFEVVFEKEKYNHRIRPRLSCFRRTYFHFFEGPELLLRI